VSENQNDDTTPAPRPRARKAKPAPVRTLADDIAGDPLLKASYAEVGSDQEPEVAREAQHPSLIGDDGVEVAQRSVDVPHLDTDPEASTTEHRKQFVLLKREWDTHTDEQKATVHERNIRAVRQFLVGNGLRPTGDVEFAGEETVEVAQTGRLSNDSVVLTYTVSATPTVTTGSDLDGKGIELVHTVIPQDGASAQEQADYEADTEARVLAARGVRVGTVPGPKPSLTATA